MRNTRPARDTRTGDRAVAAPIRGEAPRPARTEVAVARRYLEHGFLDAAIRLFVRHAAHTTPDDWDRLAGRLRERRRLRYPRPRASRGRP